MREIVSALQQTRKYRHVCQSTQERIAEWALNRYPRPKDAIKMAKNKLHQIYGAYLDRLDADPLASRVLDAPDDESVRACCVDVMRSHASTAERLPQLDQFYDDIFSVMGVPSSVMDLACGLHPFAIPWMGLPTSTWYCAVDIDTRLTRLHNALLCRLGMSEAAQCDDILTMNVSAPVDLVFLLKTLPCLEQQEAGASHALLGRLNAQWIVVSVPTETLGGRKKGMAAHYARQYEGLLPEFGEVAGDLEFGNERVWVVRRG